MAITTYAELQTAVGNWLARSDLSSRIPEFIELFEAKARRDLRLRPMETTGDITIDAQTEAVPAGFLEVRRFYLDLSPIIELQYITPARFWSKFLSSTGGVPTHYSVEGTNFIFGPSPDGSYTGKLLYLKQFDGLATTSPNYLLTEHPDLYLYGSLMEAEAYVGNDPRVQMWKNLYEECAKRAMRQEERSRFGSAPLVMRPDVWA